MRPQERTGERKPQTSPTTGENPRVSVDHYENFPVASLLCPPRIRPAVAAVYHFARTADDLADEGSAKAAERLEDLAQYRADLQAVLNARTPSPRWAPLFLALGKQQQAFRLPPEPLHDLLDAFEQDVHNPAYPDRAMLLDYCRRSANPVGRLLLHLYGIQDARSLQQSDAICTALQLINFWQDLSVDGPRGRCYVPETDRDAHGVHATALARGLDSLATRKLVQSLAHWAQQLMLQGAPLALRVQGRAGWELRLVVQGGLRILEKIRHMDHATLQHRPRLFKRDLPLLLWRASRMPGANP
jgi:hydroxysqualene synthase